MESRTDCGPRAGGPDLFLHVPEVGLAGFPGPSDGGVGV